MQSVHPEYAAGSVLRDLVNRAPQSGNMRLPTVKADDQKICLVLVKELDEGINFSALGQFSYEFDTLPQRDLTGIRLHLFIKRSPIFGECASKRTIGSGGIGRVR